MSKLKMFFSILFSVFLLTGFQHFQKSEQKSSKHSHEDTKDKEIWGKSRGPILVKIESQKRKNLVIEFKGLVQSEKKDISTEWKLPEGAVLVSGELNSTVAQVPAGGVSEVSIVVDMSQANDEPIVFSAFVLQDAARMGHTRAFKWNRTTEELEHLEKIQLKMKKRNSKFIR